MKQSSTYSRLRMIKILHTCIWIFFNLVMAYLVYAIFFGEIDIWVWIGFGLFILEAIVLLAWKMSCPLTVMARRYSNSTRENFDIYLPNWLAKYNKRIYTSILVLLLIVFIYRLII